MTGVSDLASIDAQMDLARELVPNAKNIGLIYCSSEVNSEIQANMVKDYCKANGLNVVEKTVNNVNDIQQTAESFAGQVDLIYTPTDNTIASAFPALVKVRMPARFRSLPVLTSWPKTEPLPLFPWITTSSALRQANWLPTSSTAK